jgi:thiamine-phosphate pyrophosphorylase
MPKGKVDWTLYVVTDKALAGGRSHAAQARAAILGGATVIQYREKVGNTRQLIEEASAVRDVCRELGATFIVNDRVDVALAVGADGVHVGQEDMPAIIARRLIGPDMLLGVTVGNVAQALQAEADGAGYLGTDAVFFTGSKPDAGPPIGVDSLAEICRATPLPVVGIGGVNAGNVAQVIQAGVAGAAVISAVVSAPDMTVAARKLREAISRARAVSGLGDRIERIRERGDEGGHAAF